MKQTFRHAIAVLSIALSAAADLPYLDITSDVQRSDAQFDIKRVAAVDPFDVDPTRRSTSNGSTAATRP